MDKVLAELEQLPAPDGLNTQTWDELKSALAGALADNGRSRIANAIAPPTKSNVDDLALTTDGTAATLSWSYRNVADYDQNGEVNVADLTPLGSNLGKNTASPDWNKAQLADGDNNGEINIADVTPIGAGFRNAVNGYSVQYSSDGSVGSWTEIGQVQTADGEVPAEGGMRVFSFSIPDAADGSYRVVPFAGDEQGGASNAVLKNTAPPVISAVNPIEGSEGSVVGFSATITGAGAGSFQYAWDFGGGADPNLANNGTPQVTLGSAGAYDASLTVTGVYGEDTFDFTLTVTEVTLTAPVIVVLNDLTGTSGQEVSASATVEGQVDAWAWDFGGGASPNTSSESAPSVTLGAEGVYFGNLTVSNGAGQDSQEFSIIVGDAGSPPIIRGVSPRIGGTGEQVQWSIDYSGSANQFSWDFGAGAIPQTSNEASPTVTMGSVGMYTLTLTVGNVHGSDTEVFSYEVTEEPQGTAPDILFVNPTSGEEDEQITMDVIATGSEPITWSWDFGGAAFPNTSSDKEPTVVLTGAPGFYTVSVTAENSRGSVTYEIENFEIRDLP